MWRHPVARRVASRVLVRMDEPGVQAESIGDDHMISVGGEPRRYVGLDSAATTSASEAVVRAVQEFLPWYSSVHRGAGAKSGAKSQHSSARYEEARETVLRFVGADAAMTWRSLRGTRPKRSS
jgi:selenocysteine lyase/cysteine desulfurase